MTVEEQQRLWNLVQSPPPGSKIAAAKEYGVDLTLILRALKQSPAERAEAMHAALEFAEELRNAALARR
jgi:hypothetical protein